MNARLVRRTALSMADRRDMLSLLTRYFRGVTPATFERDLEEKRWVLLLHAGGQLCGFTTLLGYDTMLAGKAISVAYSGDTIVDPSAWHNAALPRAWIAAVRRLRDTELTGERLYWLLLTSGFRTYRMLPVFWREFYPRYDVSRSHPLAAPLETLARERFGTLYHPETGIVRLPSPQQLDTSLADVPAGRLNDPHVAFFLDRNPSWRLGDELVCLTEISYDNLTPAGRRMWGPPHAVSYLDLAG